MHLPPEQGNAGSSPVVSTESGEMIKILFIPWFIAALIVTYIDLNAGMHHLTHVELIANYIVGGIFLAGLAGFLNMNI